MSIISEIKPRLKTLGSKLKNLLENFLVNVRIFFGLSTMPLFRRFTTVY